LYLLNILQNTYIPDIISDDLELAKLANSPTGLGLSLSKTAALANLATNYKK